MKHRPAPSRSYHSDQVATPATGVDKVALLCVVTSLSGAMVWIPVLAEPVGFDYNIPAQSLNDALIEFAAKSNLELVFPVDDLRGLSAPALKGRMSVEQGLRTLLQNSRLTFRFLDARTITLETGERPTNPRRAPVALPPVTVIGKPIAEPADDVASYTLDRMQSATLTDTPVRRIPQTVAGVTRDLLDDQQAVTVSEALSNVSGVVARNPLYSPVLEGTLIRGFPSEQLLDGFTQYYNPGDRESTINVASLEVLKGSNALLYAGGSGAPVGGVVNLISKQARPEAFGEFGFRTGSHDYFQPNFDINQPLHSRVWLRMTGEFTDAGNRVDAVETQRYNLNPALTFTDNHRNKLTLRGKLSHWRQTEYQGLPATGTLAGRFRLPPDSFIGPADAPQSRSDSQAIWGEFEHRWDKHWTITLKSRVSRASFDQRVQTLFGDDGFIADRPLSALGASAWGLVNAELYQRQREFSVLGYLTGKFASENSEHTLVIGADRGELDDIGFVGADLANTGLVDLAQPNFGLRYAVPEPAQPNQFIGNLTYGGYLQWQGSFYNRLHLLAGLRRGKVSIDFRNTASGRSTSTDAEKWLPRLGVAVDIGSAWTWFAGYSEGMRGQPFVEFADTPLPELARHVETGLKFDIDGTWRGQLAVYRIDRERVAVPDGSDALLRSTASGGQSAEGTEADLNWRLSEGLDLLGNYAYTLARYQDDKAGVPAGNRLPQVPDQAGRLWLNYQLPASLLPGWRIGVGVNLSAGAYLSKDNRFKTSGYHCVDASLGYETSAWKLAATVKNLSGEHYYRPFDYFDGRVAPGADTELYFNIAYRY
ncbi:TonB-dependent siderophore receptor [Methylomonas sp. MED-D]|uniref:TonB-dependent siderophore receptor n=1 Tax=unclassified Methylomonas TaxID=2608980 RepID=UPI0028A30E17|nr:TonB-dependent receptor [Methylomonas sp. MV1]MDT4328343.1 TonB-dependent receptor [Methylomonas sp. MV1]